MNFYDWLTTFWAEKGLEYGETMPNGKGETIQAGDVVQAMINTTPLEQAQIKSALCRIDFHNGDVMDYVRHMAKAL